VRTGMVSHLRDTGPWFVDRPRLTLVTAAVLTVAAAGLLFAGGEAAADAPLLLCLPVALLATTFGTRGGFAGAVAAAVLVAAWAFTTHALGAAGWVARTGPLALLGVLLGDATDRWRRAEATRARLADAERRQRDAVQLNDTIVQSLAAAKWALERSDLPGGLAIVDETLERSNRMVSDLIRGAELRPLWTGDRPAD
jgi:hypothetical protein